MGGDDSGEFAFAYSSLSLGQPAVVGAEQSRTEASGAEGGKGEQVQQIPPLVTKQRQLHGLNGSVR